MRIIRLSFRLLAFAGILALTSCGKEDSSTPSADYSKGIFIVNEGKFTDGTGTITYFDPQSHETKQDLFGLVNEKPLGNIAQSMCIFNGKGYIVVNNAGKVEVVDIKTFKSLGTITQLHNPSQFLVIDSTKAYVSDWAGNVAVVNLKTDSVTKKIQAGTGPDALLKSGNMVYVANEGGFGSDNTVMVINTQADEVIKTITVGDMPVDLFDDGRGNVWVLCKGIGYNGYPLATDTKGRLVRINKATNEMDFYMEFQTTSDHPDRPVYDKQHQKIYFLYNNSIYRFNLAQVDNPIMEVVVSNKRYYTLGFEDKTGYVYATDARDYVSSGMVYRYDPATTNLIDSIPAGITPHAIVFGPSVVK